MRIRKFILFLLCFFFISANPNKIQFNPTIYTPLSELSFETKELVVHDDSNKGTYLITNCVLLNRKIHLNISDKEPLIWNKQRDFWSAYPDCEIENGIITSDKKVVIAHTKWDYGISNVHLLFYPAYTTFKFDVGEHVKRVWIESKSPLQGVFKGSIDDILHRKDVEYSDAKYIVECENFEAFCLPINIQGLIIHYETDEEKTIVYDDVFPSCGIYWFEIEKASP